MGLQATPNHRTRVKPALRSHLYGMEVGGLRFEFKLLFQTVFTAVHAVAKASIRDIAGLVEKDNANDVFVT